MMISINRYNGLGGYGGMVGGGGRGHKASWGGAGHAKRARGRP